MRFLLAFIHQHQHRIPLRVECPWLCLGMMGQPPTQRTPAGTSPRATATQAITHTRRTCIRHKSLKTTTPVRTNVVTPRFRIAFTPPRRMFLTHARAARNNSHLPAPRPALPPPTPAPNHRPNRGQSPAALTHSPIHPFTHSQLPASPRLPVSRPQHSAPSTQHSPSSSPHPPRRPPPLRLPHLPLRHGPAR
jgi:hypothetical protein